MSRNLTITIVVLVSRTGVLGVPCGGPAAEKAARASRLRFTQTPSGTRSPLVDPNQQPDEIRPGKTSVLICGSYCSFLKRSQGSRPSLLDNT
jgi:hypothetical protein